MSFQISEKGKSITITASAKDQKQAFADTARGFFSLAAGTERIKDDIRIEVAVQAPSSGALLGAWLAELSSRANAQGVFFSEFSVFSIQKVSAKEFLLYGSANGEAISAKDQRFSMLPSIGAKGGACDEKKDKVTCSITVTRS